MPVVPSSLYDVPLYISTTLSAVTFLYTRNKAKSLRVFCLTTGLSLAFCRICLPWPVIHPIPAEDCHPVGVKFFEASGVLPRYALYYPTMPQEKPERFSWVPYDDSRYVTEFAKNMNLPAIALGHLSKVKIQASRGGQALKENAHRYILFSHGLHGHQTMYSTMAMELASRGYHVLCPEHTDGSATFTVDEKSNPIHFTPVTGMSVSEQLTYRYKQLGHRTDEFLAILKHATPNAADIVLAGHSFGGCTALNALCELSIYKTEKSKDAIAKPLVEKFSKVRHTMLFDLWPFAMTGHEGVQKIKKLKNAGANSPPMKHSIPHVTFLNSEDWDDWDEFTQWSKDMFFSDTRVTAFFETDFFPYTDHYSISDMGLFTPLIGRKKIPHGMSGAKHMSEWARDFVDICKADFEVV